METIANTDMAAAWDGEEGAHWAANADWYERVSARMWERFEAAVHVEPDAAILDIGCGAGRSTRACARLAPKGSALGVDLSAAMLDLARARAREEGLDNVQFVQADAQVHPFDAGAFDLAISSFGCMFFADPVAAYRNIAPALRPGGRVALLAWRDLADNAWMTAVRGALAVGRELPSPPPNMPGPFGFADDEHVRRVLDAAGFVEVRVDRVDEPMDFGTDADDAFDFLSSTGMVHGMTQDLDEQTRQGALDSLRAALRAHTTSDGVRAGGSAWLITASRP